MHGFMAASCEAAASVTVCSGLGAHDSTGRSSVGQTWDKMVHRAYAHTHTIMDQQ